MDSGHVTTPPRPIFMRALGLLPPYSVRDVKKAYREKARRLHPDLGGDPEEFKALHRAYREATEYAGFRESRRLWLRTRVERYVQRERVITQIESFGGRCELGPIDAYVRDYGPDFAEVIRELAAVDMSQAESGDQALSWVDSLGELTQEIRTLALRNAHISEVGLMRLATLNKLSHLDLRETRIPKHAVNILASLSLLEWIHLGATGVGYWGRRRLRRTIPGLVIATSPHELPPDEAPWREYVTILTRIESR